MKTSLDRIVYNFKKFALGDPNNDNDNGHQQIFSFRTEPLSKDIASSFIYPLMWIDSENMNVTFQAHQLLISFPVFMLDRIEKDFSNEIDVKSSALLKLDDFLTYFGDKSCELGFDFQSTGNATPITFEFDDWCAGYRMNVICQVGTSKNESQIPM